MSLLSTNGLLGGGLQGLGTPATRLSSDEGKLVEAARAARNGDQNEAAAAFQQVLSTMLVKEMRQSLGKGLTGDGPGSDVYSGWFDEHLGRVLAEDDALGLAGLVKAGIGRVAQASEDAEVASEPRTPEEQR